MAAWARIFGQAVGRIPGLYHSTLIERLEEDSGWVRSLAPGS
jgi:hypothetical protein